MDKNEGPIITIQDLYPNMDDAQQKEAEENLDQYLEVVLRIYERIKSDPKAYANFKALTESKERSIMGPTRTDPPEH